MLSSGKVSVQEAEQLLQAVSAPGQSADEKKAEPKYFRVLVNKPAREGKRPRPEHPRAHDRRCGGLRLGSCSPMLAKKRSNWPTAASSTCRRTYGSRGVIKDIGELTVDVDSVRRCLRE
jgi:hypothetical protein